MSKSIAATLATELQVRQEQVDATIRLLDEGSTVPFISRYRKEVTGSLDDTQLRQLEQRLGYLRELEDRRGAILKSIADQDKLSPELRASIEAADTKTDLEDLYLPYKPKRRTKAQIAREAGLEPLADALLGHPELDPETAAGDYLNPDLQFADTKAVLDGARQILMERFAEDADLLGQLRKRLWEQAVIRSAVVAGKETEGAKFSDYFDFSEKFSKIPSHRVLAILRGRNEGVLSLQLVSDAKLLDDPKAVDPCLGMIARAAGIEHQGRNADDWLATVVQWTWRVKLHLYMETELITRIREQAETDAIAIFAENLGNLLMAAPAGKHVTMGLDPGLRTGTKVVIVDDTGKLLAHTTIFPHQPQNQWDQSLRKLKTMCTMHKVSLISVGNGTASRETDKLAGEVIKACPELKMQKIMVSEAGASVYSASALAAEEFPDLDVTFRGAVSIARRLQDPMAELVKIEPKSIGVGQYQHDVSQSQLAKSLESTIEDCVNAVGVDLNLASAPLLARVSGLNKTLARNIVAARDAQGRFKNRQQLLDVSRLGPKAFEQAAGFLRITDGDTPLDASAVHPEAYPVVEKILASRQLDSIEALMGKAEVLRKLTPADFADDQFGVPTVTDILAELEKPGRDPRPEFKTATFTDGVETLKDLKPGMRLEGVVTNVTAFGAFVDIGVHQDGLVHVSALADRFIKDPSEVVKTGDIIMVYVLDVDLPRKRIALSVKAPKQGDARAPDQPRAEPGRKSKPRKPAKPAPQGAFGDALAAALKKS